MSGSSALISIFKKYLLNERDQQRIVGRTVTKVRESQLITLYGCGEQKSIQECTTFSNLEADGLEKKTSMSGSSSVNQDQKVEAPLGRDSTKLDRKTECGTNNKNLCTQTTSCQQIRRGDVVTYWLRC